MTETRSGARPRRWIAWAAAAVAVPLLALVAYVISALVRLPLPGDFENPQRAALDLASARGRVFAVRGVAYGQPVSLERLPPHLVDAFVVMEDRRFRSHGGLDLRGTLRAALVNLFSGETRQGGSTLTQQLVKNLFLTPERTFLRKTQEALLAFWLERHATKEEILERYLDTVYLGAGAYGVEAASRRYFGKSAENVTLAEAALLAGLVPAPSRLAPTVDLEAARRRTELVLDAMVAEGAVSEEDAKAAKKDPARLARPPVESAAFGFAADWAAAEARELLSGVSGDFVVRTTIDPGLQRLASRVVREGLEAAGEAAHVSEGALVAMRPDGAVVALVGGRDFASSQYNRATQARRQPGSVFKLFVYLAALEAGRQPSDPIEDAPITVEGWSPKNAGGRYVGRTTLAQAFSRSSNVAAVRLQEQIGRSRVISLARRMGLSASMEPRPSLALGTYEVTLMELTAAMAAVRAHAERVEPWIVRTIESRGGASFRARRSPLREAPWPKQASLDLLAGVVRSGTGRAAALDVPAYGKTGTTQSYRDAWFVGFAEDLIVGVWVGNDDDSPMRRVTGGGLPARLWHDFVSVALRDGGLPGDEEDEGGTTASDEVVIGVPKVIDTATFEIDDRPITLDGVEGVGGLEASRMEAYIGGREITCHRTERDRHRCTVDGWDLSEVVLFNGGGRATSDAPPELVDAEQKARRERRGLWRE